MQLPLFPGFRVDRDGAPAADALKREGRAWREFHTRYDRLIYRAIHKVTQRFAAVLSSADVDEIYALFMCSLNTRDMHRLRTFEPGAWPPSQHVDRALGHERCLGLPAHGGAPAGARERSRAEDLRCSSPDPFHALAAKEEWSRVSDMLSGFSEKDRTFVDLFFLQGRTPEQIAEEMQISVKTVYSKKHKIRCRLESVLGIAQTAEAA